MTHSGAAPAEGRLGGRPARGAPAGCVECGHPHALHGNGMTGCRAFACTAGPGNQPCQQFVSPPEATAEPARLAS